MSRIFLVMVFFLGGCAHISLPYPSGGCPVDFPVKGNAGSQIYHTPESPYYKNTDAEVCFDSAEAARKNGFIAPKR